MTLIKVDKMIMNVLIMFEMRLFITNLCPEHSLELLLFCYFVVVVF